MCNCGSLVRDYVQLWESGARPCAITGVWCETMCNCTSYDFSVVCVISIVPGCRGVGRWGWVQEESDGGGSNEGAAGVTGMKTTIVVSHHQRDALGVVWFSNFCCIYSKQRRLWEEPGIETGYMYMHSFLYCLHACTHKFFFLPPYSQKHCVGRSLNLVVWPQIKRKKTLVNLNLVRN